MKLLLACLLIAWGTIGCSSDGKDGGFLDGQVASPDSKTDGGPVTVPVEDSAVVSPDTAPPQKFCGPSSYPQGPFGTQNGSVVANLEFDGFADPNHLCKDPMQMAMDLSSVRKITFKEWYLGDYGCCDKKKRLLWVMVSAGWCGPCHEEVKATVEQYKKGAIDKRVAILNVVYETDARKPVTLDFLKLWAKNNQFQLSFPVAADPSFVMGKYFDKNAVPFNMLVDLDTMKIIFRQSGANLPAVGSAMFKFLQGL